MGRNSRLDKMLHIYLDADDTSLNAAISRKMMCAIVRRAKHPGCKFDAQPVLQGPQGIQKSMYCEDLAVSPDLYTDAGDLSGTVKEQMEIIQGKQIIEFPELAGYSRASREHNKAMLSRKVDRARLSYAHYATDAPRQSIPIATTNEGHYLNDPTGERRYWHVAVAYYDRNAFLPTKISYTQRRYTASLQKTFGSIRQSSRRRTTQLWPAPRNRMSWLTY